MINRNPLPRLVEQFSRGIGRLTIKWRKARPEEVFSKQAAKLSPCSEGIDWRFDG